MLVVKVVAEVEGVELLLLKEAGVGRLVAAVELRLVARPLRGVGVLVLLVVVECWSVALAVEVVPKFELGVQAAQRL